MNHQLDRVEKRRIWLPVILFAAAAYFPLFLHLGTQPLKNFDESLFALRAYRIAHYGQYLNNFIEFPDGPSATNTKPALFSLIQAISFKIFGYNELALRLPVALSVVALLWLILRFSRKETGSYAWGLFAGLVLITSQGFIRVHVSRTGDHDAPLAVFGWIALTCLFRYFQTERKEARYLWLFTGALIAATLTKSVAGLFFVPGIIVWLLWERQLVPFLKDRKSWLAIGAYILVIGGYYLYREIDYPGFLAGMWGGELGGHYFETRDGHLWPWYWYAQRLFTLKYMPWLMLLPLGMLLILHKSAEGLRPYGRLMIAAAISWLTVISFSGTKLEWYDASLYPVFAMLTGYGIYRLWLGLINFSGEKNSPMNWGVTGLFCLAFFLMPYVNIMKKVYEPKDIDYPGERYGYLVEQTTNQFPEIRDYTILHEGHSTHALFYQLTRNHHQGYHISRLKDAALATEGQVIMACQPKVLRYLKDHYEVEPITGKEGCELLKLIRKKED